MKSYTFTSLFKEKIPLGNDGDDAVITDVVIPRIQRPYAQGRKTNGAEKVRNDFLESLFGALLAGSDEPGLDLNFIYGKVEKSKDGKCVMELLDGQQRFTTLFLLHWYLLNREDVPAGDGDDILKALKSFRYETRETSTDFCNMLGEIAEKGERFDFCEACPSASIRASLRYVHPYDSDPTIGAMLTMLDAIHNVYVAKKKDVNVAGKIWRNLERIKFNVLTLSEFKLSEELYVKMNARGLPLTPFDCFKSDFLGLYKVDKMDKMVNVSTGEKANDGDKNPVPFKQYFSTKLDSEWCDLFWDSDNPDHSRYGAAYMLFFSRYFSSRFILDNPFDVAGNEWRKNSDIKLLFSGHENDHDHYHGIGPFARMVEKQSERNGYFEDIANIFKLLKKAGRKEELLQAMIPLWDEGKTAEKAKVDYFRNGDEYTEPQLVVFGSVVSFLKFFPDCNMEIFKAWMKVVHCVVENTDISNYQDMATALQKLNELLAEIAKSKPDNEIEFYKGMAANAATIENAAIKEEVEKARRIVEEPESAKKWIALFDEVMRHQFLKGTIGFYYSEKMSYDDFSSHFKLVGSLFDGSGISKAYRGGDFLLIRAIMSRLVSEEEVNKKFVTEDSDGDKRLKNLLTSNREPELQARIHDLFSNKLFALSKNAGATVHVDVPVDKVKEALQDAIAHAPEIDVETGWDWREVLSVLRVSTELYRWVQEGGGPKKIYWNYNQIQVRTPHSRDCVMAAAFRYVRKLKDEFFMKAIDFDEKMRCGYKHGEIFIGQELRVEKPLENFNAINAVVVFRADYKETTPVDLRVEWPDVKESNEAGERFHYRLKSTKVDGLGNVETGDIKVDKVKKIRYVDIGHWQFSPGEDGDNIDFEGLKSQVDSLLKFGSIT